MLCGRQRPILRFTFGESNAFLLDNSKTLQTTLSVQSPQSPALVVRTYRMIKYVASSQTPFEPSTRLKSVRDLSNLTHMPEIIWNPKENLEMTHHSVHSHFLQKRLEVNRKPYQKPYLELSFWEREKEENRRVSPCVGMNERERVRARVRETDLNL